MLYQRVLKKLSLMTLLLSLAACQATHTAINKRQLSINTKMSHSLFLEPIAPELKTVYLQIRNTSGIPGLDITDNLKDLLTQKGYRVVLDPVKAHYLLQANLLSVVKNNPQAALATLDEGYGAALTGAAVGAAVGSLGHHHRDQVIFGSLAGAAISSVAGALVDDVTYSAIMDIQISERQTGKQRIAARTVSKLAQGRGTVNELVSTDEIPWKRYQTRIAGSANQVNLKFEQAQGALSAALANSLAGIF